MDEQYIPKFEETLPTEEAPPSFEETSPVESQTAQFPQIQDSSSLASDVSDLVIAAGQGAAMGFGDEAIAALKSLLKEGDLSKYRELQQKYQEQYKQLQQRSPTLSTIGELGGGLLIPGIGAGGAIARGATVGEKLLPAIKAGAAIGGISSIGGSETYLKPEELAESAKELGTEGLKGAAWGAGLGAGFGLAGQTLGKLGQWGKEYVQESPALQRALSAHELERGGIKLTTESGAQKIREMEVNAAKTTADNLLAPLKKAKEKYGELIQKVQNEKITPIDPTSKQVSNLFVQTNNLFKQVGDVLPKVNREIYRKFTIPERQIFDALQEDFPKINKRVFDSLVDVYNNKTPYGLEQLFAAKPSLKKAFETPEFQKLFRKFSAYYKKSLPSGGTINDLLNLRREILNNSDKLYNQLDLNSYHKLFGSGWDPKTGEKIAPGFVDRLDDMIHDISPDIKMARQEIKSAARPAEQFINKNVDVSAQPTKLFDLDDEQSRNRLERMLVHNIEIAGGTNRSAINARYDLNNLRNTLKDVQAGAEQKYPELKGTFSDPDKLINHLLQTSKKSSALTSTIGIRQTGETSGKDLAEAFGAVNLPEMTATQLMGKTGRLQKFAEPVSEPIKKAAETTKEKIEFPIQKAATTLKASESPAMQRLGMQLEDALQNKKGAAAASVLNSLFQSETARKELGIEPGQAYDFTND